MPTTQTRTMVLSPSRSSTRTARPTNELLITSPPRIRIDPSTDSPESRPTSPKSTGNRTASLAHDLPEHQSSHPLFSTPIGEPTGIVSPPGDDRG